MRLSRPEVVRFGHRSVPALVRHADRADPRQAVGVRARGLILVIAVTAAAGAPALRGGFVTDDHHVIERGRLIGSWRRLGDLWTHDTMHNSDLAGDSRRGQLDTYRPLTMTTFVLDHALWGVVPTGYHLTNLILHLVCVALVFVLAKRALGREGPAAAAALLFGLHPVTSEAWVWINGRSDIVATLFFLGAALLAERCERATGGRAVAAAVAMAVCILGACLAKETAFIAAALAFVRPRLPVEEAGPPLRARRPAVIAGAVAAVAIGLGLRVHALAGLSVTWGTTHLVEAARALPVLLGLGTLDVLVPRHTAPRLFAEDISDLGPAGQALLAALAVVAVAAAIRARRRAPWLVWGVLGYAACVAPGALTVPLRWDGQGRYFYLPLAIAAGPVVGSALLSVPRAAKRAVGALCTAWGLTLIVLLQATILAFRSDMALGRAAIEEFPERSHGWGRTGVELCRAGRVNEGMPMIQRALEIAPSDPQWLYHLATCAFDAGQFARALDLNLRGQGASPQDPRFRCGAAHARMSLGDLDRALTDIGEAARLHGQLDSVLDAARRWIDLRPPHGTARMARLSTSLPEPFRGALREVAEKTDR
jgi:protein O-mannosyl-transferase